MEMGSTFALMVSSSPLLATHVLGMTLDAFGADHVLWGTDSIWWGSPQWQIERSAVSKCPTQRTKALWLEATDGRSKTTDLWLECVRSSD